MVNRTYTYIIVGIGLLLIVAGALKLPGGVMAGAALVFLGAALFGLSFVPRGTPPPDAPPPMPFLQKLANILFEPSRVFQNLRAHPSWLLALLLVVAFNFAYEVAFNNRLTQERIVGYTMDKTAESGFIPADKVAEIKAQQIEEAKDPVRQALAVVTKFVGTFALSAFFAGLILLLVMLLGGRIGFWQALSVTVWSALPATIISRVLSLVLLYVKDPDEIHPILGQSGLVTDNLGVLFKPAEHPVLFSAASAVGLLIFYRVWLLAVGIRHGGERVKSSTGWTISIAFWVVGLCFGLIIAALFGNFIS